jgi:hypothetical protein
MKFMKKLKEHCYKHWKTTRKGTKAYSSTYHWYKYSSKWYKRYKSAFSSLKKTKSGRKARRVWRFKVSSRLLQPPVAAARRAGLPTEKKAGKNCWEARAGGAERSCALWG